MQEYFNYTKRVIVGLIIIFALLFLCAGIAVGYYAMLPTVTIKVNNVTIRQDEALPEIQAEVQYEGKEMVVLDETAGYSTEDLQNELNRKVGYSFQTEADVSKEGKYELQVVLDDELSDKINRVWKNKINFEVINGTIEVLNKYGDWEDTKFRLLDGTYASGWMNLGDDTYYFDENGDYVTDKLEYLGNTYFFKKNGTFDKEKNRVNPNRPMIALTFDDGPGPYTMQLLEQLEACDARATFFMVGTNVNRYPKAIQKMAQIGCELGNHTTNHARLTTLDDAGVAGEINVTNAAISAVAGQEASLVRPPYGAVDDRVAALTNKPIVLWCVDTLDWEAKNATVVRDYVLGSVKDGDIVLLHDIHETTVQAAMEFIPQLIERGYQLVTVSEMAKARGITLEAGQKYYSFKK